ncbi:RusA-like Holliday junction resolvase [Streptomyces phage phiSASD1]|uniref:Gp10 n=1 Tax=Streptomyces phage phiSASD1 TaxID=747763 RepID=D7NW79_9CAUD|nr:RusA-like Holliday junction resolvase [Streptomyces phage phiSASD1]ADE43477.1 gp10 [Streptomyces phage phiSASD1]
MANPSKARGTRWESAIRDYLNGVLGYSHPTDWRLVKRQAQEGAKDVGDLHAWPFILEAKDVKSPAVPTWLRQAEAEAVNAGFPYGVVIHKVRGKGPALARVHITQAGIRRLMENQDFPQDIFPLNYTKRGTYWTWTLAEFAQVLAAVRAAGPPV